MNKCIAQTREIIFRSKQDRILLFGLSPNDTWRLFKSFLLHGTYSTCTSIIVAVVRNDVTISHPAPRQHLPFHPTTSHTTTTAHRVSQSQRQKPFEWITYYCWLSKTQHTGCDVILRHAGTRKGVMNERERHASRPDLYFFLSFLLSLLHLLIGIFYLTCLFSLSLFFTPFVPL
jgi:hypothetical protein